MSVLPDGVPQGQLFTQLYVSRGNPSIDSSRMRTRLATALELDAFAGLNSEIVRAISLTLGLEFEWGRKSSRYGQHWAGDFVTETDDVRDVLALVTVIYNAAEAAQKRIGNYMHRPATGAIWVEFVRKVFSEENVGYVVDDLGGVHPMYDTEFNHNVAATVAGLAAARYSGIRASLTDASKKFEQMPPDFKGAVKDIFDAVETLCKLIARTGKALDTKFVETELKPKIDGIYASDAAARQAGPRLAASFADWVNSAHPYRHGHESESAILVPEELAILIYSQGASFLRWLAFLDSKINP